jgi:hypothetical protein
LVKYAIYIFTKIDAPGVKFRADERICRHEKRKLFPEKVSKAHRGSGEIALLFL